MRKIIRNFRVDAGNYFSLKEPGLWTVTVHRLRKDVARMPPGAARQVCGLAQRAMMFALRLATRSVVDPTAELGLGVRLVHGLNLSIGPGVVIGDDVEIMQDVSITAREGAGPAPRIGNGVFIGAGATVLGPVVVGDGAAIGPNSLVISDVPAGAFAIGVPAKVVRWKAPLAVV